MSEDWGTPTIYEGPQPGGPPSEPEAGSTGAAPVQSGQAGSTRAVDPAAVEPYLLPGDLPSLAYATASQEPVRGAAWSPTIYHGRRRHRPRKPPPSEHAGRAAQPPGPGLDRPAEQAPDQPPGPRLDRPAEQAPDQPVGPGLDQPAEPAVAAGAGAERGPGRDAEPSLLSSSRTMAIASLASRATGFIRTMVIGAVLGAGVDRIADAYNLGNTLPNMVYELLLGGVLSSVIIPVLVKAQQDDADRGVAYTQRLLSIATVGLAAATLLAVLAAPLLIALYQGDRPFHSLAALWATLLLPEIFFYGVGAMISAILNTRHVYGWPAWAPVLNNLITILAAGLFYLVPGPARLTASSITNTQILVLGIGTTLGIVAQAAVLIVPLRSSGFRWRWRFRAAPNESGRLAEFRNLTVWVLGYVAISQLGVYMVGRTASGVVGGVTYFTNADLLFQVPYGIVGVSLLTALMPRMSRYAAAGNIGAVLDDLRLGTRLSAVALVPVSAGLVVLGPAFTSVILLGRFHLSEARLVGTALAAAAFGLLPFALVMLQQRVFYALRDARTPTFINLAMVATKVCLLLAAAAMLHGRALIVSLTVSTSLSYLAGCLAGHVLLRRRFGPLGFAAVGRTVALITLAAVLGAAVALTVVLVTGGALGDGRIAGLIETVVGGGLGLIAMVWVALRLPLPDVKDILGTVRRRPERLE
jgi:putative peptidoglycan lipid II flippase